MQSATPLYSMIWYSCKPYKSWLVSFNQVSVKTVVVKLYRIKSRLVSKWFRFLLILLIFKWHIANASLAKLHLFICSLKDVSVCQNLVEKVKNTGVRISVTQWGGMILVTKFKWNEELFRQATHRSTTVGSSNNFIHTWKHYTHLFKRQIWYILACYSIGHQYQWSAICLTMPWWLLSPSNCQS